MDVFVARQPIFDVKKNVYAYELLFRSGFDNVCDCSVSGDHASTSVISDSLLVIGLDTLTMGKKAFVNCTQNVLVSGAAAMLPRENVVIEILESVSPDDDVIRACEDLKEAGFSIALDDFVVTEQTRPFLPFADIVKVDFLETTGDARKKVMDTVGRERIDFLAEKVETEEIFQEAFRLGYAYFQGYFFNKPMILQGRDVPGNKLNLMKVLYEINRPEVDFDTIEPIIKRDVSLSYKLLRFMNSAFFGFNAKIESIKHALVLLGIKEIKKWASLIAMRDLSYDKPRELLTLSVIRAKLCESIALKLPDSRSASDYFMMGLFSVIDALVDRPMSGLLEELPMIDEIKTALQGGDNSFADVYKVVLAYEKGEWDEISKYSDKLSLDEGELPGLYLEAVQWAGNAV